MNLHNIKAFTAVLLSLFLAFNPIIAAAAAGSSVASKGYSPSSQVLSTQQIYEQMTFLVGCMLKDDRDSLSETPSSGKSKEGLLDPLIETIGNYFSGILEEEEFTTMLDTIIEDILADDFIADFDMDAIIVEILRDEWLAEILGASIAGRLKDEEFLGFVSWATSEVSRLLKDENFAIFIRHSITKILSDDRLVDMLQDLLDILIKVPEGILASLRDDERIGAVISDLIHLLENAIEDILSNTFKDEKVKVPLEKILSKLELLLEGFQDSFFGDERIETSLSKLESGFLEPAKDIFGDLLSGISIDEILGALIGVVLEVFENDPDLQAILTRLGEDLEEQLEQLGEDLDLVMDYYADSVGESTEEPDPDAPPEPPDPLEGLMDQSEVEDQVSGFLNFWVEKAGASIGERQDELLAIVNRHLEEGEDPFLPLFSELMEDLLERHLEKFMADMEPILKKHLSEPSFTEIIDKYAEDPRIEEILNDALESASFKELENIIGPKKDLFMEVLEEILVSRSYGDLLKMGSTDDQSDEEKEGILPVADGLRVEIPPGVFSDLLGDAELDRLIAGLHEIVDGLPLGSLAAIIRENADFIGLTIATTILNGAADAIEEREEEEEEEIIDPRVEAIMDRLYSEERMRQLYLDLGADPEIITPETTVASVFVDLIKKAIEEHEIVERFQENAAKRVRPLEEEMEEYGFDLGARIRQFFARVFSPVKRFFDPIRRLFGYERPEEECLSNILKTSGFSAGLRWMGTFLSETLTESSAAGFIDGSIADFILNYGIIEEVATAERFSILNEFNVEVKSDEELNQLYAEYFAADLDTTIEDGMLSMRELVREISPAAITSMINDAIVNLLPAHPLRLTIRDAGMTADGILEEVAAPLEKEIPGIRKIINEKVIPALGIPLDFLEDQRVLSALAEIMEVAPEPVIAIIADILEDPRTSALLKDIINDLMQVAIGVIGDVSDVLADPGTAEAVENLVAGILSDEELYTALGNFVADLLEDEELMVVLEEALYESVDEAALGPDRYAFEPVHVIIIGIAFIPVSPEKFKIAAHNGLYSFIEVLMEWLRGENLPDGIVSMPDFARGYLLTFMNEERVRTNIAEPLTSFVIALALDMLRHPELPRLLNNRVDRAFSMNPLQLAGNKLTEGNRLAGIVGRLLSGLSMEKVTASFKDSGLDALARDIAGRIPLEEAPAFVRTNRNLRGLLEDTGLEINPSPLRSIVPLDPGIPGILLNRIADFPSEILTGFFRENDRAYRLGYIANDLPGRFEIFLLQHPGLAPLERDLIHEKLTEFDYSLIEGIFDQVATIASNEKMADFLAKHSAENFADIFASMREKISRAASWWLDRIKNFFIRGLFPAYFMLPVLFSLSGSWRIRSRKKKRPGLAERKVEP